MEQDSQQLSTSTAAVPVISRLDRLDRLLQQLEKKQSCCSSHKCSIPVPADGELDKHCKRLSSALEEVDSKGTLMERLTMLENRVVQLSLVMEDGNTSSSSTWTKTDVEPAEQEGKLISSVQKQESLIIEGKGFQEAQNGDTHNQKKRTRRKKTTSLNPYSRRWQSNWPTFAAPSLASLQIFRLQNSMVLRAKAKKDITESGDHDLSSDERVASEEAPKTVKRAPRRTKKKITMEALEKEGEEGLSHVVNDALQEGNVVAVATTDDSKKIRRTRKKAATSPTSSAEIKKRVGRRRKNENIIENTKDQESDAEDNYLEWPTMIESIEDEKEEELGLAQEEDEDISFTYWWPPLVCCYGAAQHAFVPSGRPSNRIIDHEIHDRMKDALWSPKKFVRAPGSSSSSVAIALSILGGRVAFMGKLGDDDYGQTMLYYLNTNKVQTRSIRIDSKKLTAVSHMRIARRGRLRVNCVKPCAEDSLLRSEINIDVLKEAKMFYFNSSSLLERDMRSTTLQAIKMSKRLGGVIFFDLNLPLPFWQSADETKMFIQEAWNHADIIEVTKQELEFLCGIQPSEKFDTNDNDKSKFIHYKQEVIMPLWHENLKVLFVTNGTSKIHYYTEKHNGSVHGMEDAPISPFTCDMSASGDGVVAALMRMLTVQPDLITDRKYLERTIKYAIDCGVIDQWIQGRTRGFPPNEDIEEHLNSDPNGIESITEMEHRTLGPEVQGPRCTHHERGRNV